MDNQAFFDAQGHAIESLKLFSLVRTGNEIEPAVDALEDARVRFDLSAEIVLPGTVDAVMTDGSRRPVDVTWQISDTQIAEMKSAPGVYEIAGEADGRSVRCFVTTAELNFLQNGGFEDGAADPWELNDRGGADELGVEKNKLNSLDGDCNLHFWGAKSGSIDFDAEQTAEGLAPGTYKFRVSIQGGDAGEAEIYAYVRLDGEVIATAPLAITSYNNWSTAEIRDIPYAEGQTLTVGVRVKCAGEGNGAWGMIDEACLNAQR